MLIDFDEILHDLELKRAAALALDAHPSVNVEAALAGHDTPAIDVTLVLEDGGERPLELERIAEPVADALAIVALASGEADPDTAAARAIVGAIAADVTERLHRAAQAGARRITAHDLSALVEAALIAGGYFEVAKALVLRRAVAPADASTARSGDGSLRLIRRSGEVAAWQPAKIEVAIRKAFLSLSLDSEPAVAIAARVDDRAHALPSAYVPIETVQDIVQEELVLGGHMRVAERYIVYRAERAILRSKQAPPAAAPPPPIPVLEADGSESTWTAEDLRARIAFARIGLELPLEADALERELRRAIRPGVSRADLRRLVVLNAKALVQRDSEFSLFAGRILLSYVYEEALGWEIVRDGVAALRQFHTRARSSRCCATACGSTGSTSGCWATTWTGSRRRSTRRPTSTSTSSACRRCMTGICWSTRPARSRAGSRRRSCSGCGSRWASVWASATTIRSSASSA